MKQIQNLMVAACLTGMVNLCAIASSSFNWNGFYAGGATGMTKFSENHKLAFDDPGLYEVPGEFNYVTNAGATKGPNAVLFLGYGKKSSRNPTYVGGEVGADFMNHSNQVADSALTLTSKRQAEFYANLRVGYVFKNDSILYGLFGVAYTNFNRAIHFVPGGAYNKPKDMGSLTLNDVDSTFESLGPQIGLGIMKPINDHLILGFEYKLTLYGTKQIDLDDYMYPEDTPVGEYRSNTNTQAFNLRLSYAF